MKIVVGGQMDKQSIANLVKSLVDASVTVDVKSDIEATLAVQSGMADYYIGACSTGAGGALGMAFGLLGQEKCASVSTPGHIMSQDEINHLVKSGKVAFGFVNYDAEKVVPMLIQAFNNK